MEFFPVFLSNAGCSLCSTRHLSLVVSSQSTCVKMWELFFSRKKTVTQGVPHYCEALLFGRHFSTYKSKKPNRQTAPTLSDGNSSRRLVLQLSGGERGLETLIPSWSTQATGRHLLGGWSVGVHCCCCERKRSETRRNG